jgi:E3 ubiquitin-protein ligase MUL1
LTHDATASVADARSLLPDDGDEPRIAAVRGYVRTQGSFLRAPFSGEAGVVVKHTQMVSPAVVRWRLARCVHRSD